MIGAWLRRDPAKRAKVVIATKVGFLDAKIDAKSYDGKVNSGAYAASLHPDVIAAGAVASLERMGIDTIDLYYQHRDNRDVPLADSLGAFEELRRAGKIRATGLSNFEPERVEEAIAAAHSGGFAPAVAVQGWYNLMERGKYEGPLEDIVTGRGLSFFSFYSLANGFLSGKYRSQGDLGKSVRGLRNVEYVDSDRGRRVLAALEAVAAEAKAAMASVAIAWTKSRPGVTAPIASATARHQLDELLAGMILDLSPAQVAVLDEASG